MIKKLFTKRSSCLSPAHGKGGVRATILFISAPAFRTEGAAGVESGSFLREQEDKTRKN